MTSRNPAKRLWTSENRNMTDIHAHIIPGIDDGSETMEDSLELISMAAESGVRTIVATPHCNIPGEFENYASSELEERFGALVREAERARIPIRIVRGAEVFATEDMPRLLTDGRVWTLNGTKYFLTEFAFTEDPDYCSFVLKKCADAGFKPIVAHPERYFFMQEIPEIAFDWCMSGYGLQINKGSLLGRFGPGPRRTAEMLVDHGLAACVASDAHSPTERTTHMAEIREYLTDYFGEDYMRLLLEENPSRILSGKELLGYEPIPFY